jgi:hypothetical protein
MTDKNDNKSTHDYINKPNRDKPILHSFGYITRKKKKLGI